MKVTTKFFTLIELIVVIVILGVLAAIVIPNISSFKEEAEQTSILSNQKNLQTATDMFMLQNNGATPTKDKPTIGNPQTLEVHGLHPDYTRDLPKNKGVYWWLDFSNTVWASYVDAPTNVKLSPEGTTITWNTVEGAVTYNIYKANSTDVASKATTKGFSHIKSFVPTVNATQNTDVSKIDSGTYLVSAIDSFGFETAPTKVNSTYTEYEQPDTKFSVKENIVLPPKLPRLQEVVPTGWIGIYTVEDLYNIKNTSKYILMENIDLNVAPYNAGAGWMPRSLSNVQLDGNGLKIKNLYINRPTQYNVGLFAFTDNVKISNLVLEDSTITGSSNVGTLIGKASKNTHVYRVGINNSEVKGTSYIGGLIGSADWSATDMPLSVKESYVRSASVTGTSDWIGGFIGNTNPYDYDAFTIQNNYVFADVKGDEYIGGFIGDGDGSMNFKYNYVVSTVPKTTNDIPYRNAVYGWQKVYNTYFNSELAKENYQNGSSGKTTLLMKQKATYVSWNFDTIWKIDEANDYPRLQWEK